MAVSRRVLLAGGLVARAVARARSAPARLRPRHARDIAASRLGVGFEVLDRKLFDPTRCYDALGELGVKWARCQTGWCRCEPEPGRFDFAWLDDVVDNLHAQGIRPWFNLGYGNRLYQPDAPDEAAVGWAPHFDEPTLAAWQRFVRELARHFTGRVRHVEIWNEPNITAFWKPREPNAADYVRLVAATAPILRAELEDSVLIGGALAGTPREYLDGCLAAGLADHVDRVSYHPYRPLPESGYADQVTAFRAACEAARPGLALWQGENGAPSVGGETSTGAMSELDWTEERQAKWLLRRIVGDLALELELTSYFHTIDLVGYRGKTNFKGLLRGDYSRKPSYGAYQGLCALIDSETARLEVTAELVDGRRVLLRDVAFQRGGQLLYGWWLPASLFEPLEPRTVTLRLPAAAVSWTEPVLLDPLGWTVHPGPRLLRENGAVTLADLPLRDYPLFVTDSTVIA